MKEIILFDGGVTQVDDEDFDWLNQFNWFAAKRGRNLYAARSKYISLTKTIVIYMHREILGNPSGLKSDHIDLNTLNNQKSNLRVCTNAENMRNRGKPKNNTSGFKGVYWSAERKKWAAQIAVDGKVIPLGRFIEKEQAIIARNMAAIKYHHDFAWLNPL